ncbi:hypothetical protein [Enterobacter hormaechei]|uniref:hypothetical protein n=1 Tax=Enterobacter hormaechei TaxID=158836 RepID=UPI0007A7DEC4|nr:hypothetical protein [Enterobacter hormaechei]SAI93490.1 Primosomal protein I [Enterobacter hormaechei]
MSQFLQLVDRPIAFQRSFVRLGVGITGALFLSQIVYWQNRMDGQWFYKTQADLELETGLTRYEQEGARKKLVSCGVLEESKRGIPAKLYFRVNDERLEEILMGENQQAGMWKTNNQGCGNSPNSDAENQQAGMGKTSEQLCGISASIHTVDYTETTTENTNTDASVDAPAQKRSSRDDYSPEFEQAWQVYPKRAGGNPKAAAFKAWRTRLKDGVSPEIMLAGVKRYAAYVTATGSTGTQFVKQASTFFGPDLHFEEEWQAPATSGSGRRNSMPVSGFGLQDYGSSDVNF